MKSIASGKDFLKLQSPERRGLMRLQCKHCSWFIDFPQGIDSEAEAYEQGFEHIYQDHYLGSPKEAYNRAQEAKRERWEHSTLKKILHSKAVEWSFLILILLAMAYGYYLIFMGGGSPRPGELPIDIIK